MILAVTGLITLLPLFVFLTLLICILNRGSPFFLQSRPGISGRLFTIIKFRTMSEIGQKGSITAMGGFLRRTSLDETPQLWNVLRGDMSVVGPRPLLEEYLPLYSPEQARRHDVKPGITGLAQVKGRNRLSWDQKFRYDLLYVRKQSFALDVWILAQSVGAVLSQRGVNKEVSTKFEG